MGRLLVVLLLAGSIAAADRKTKNVILVTADGLRRQEIFTGIDPMLMREKAAGMDKAPGEALRRKLWAETPEQRRERLLPFLWRRLAPRGVVLGNVEKGSAVTVTNRFRKSYPGYSEILTCRAQDDRIRNNDAIQNPHPTVLEYARLSWNLERTGVALFASWDVFRVIGENQPGTVFINAGYQSAAGTPRLEELSRLQLDALSPWNEVRHDYVTAEMAFEHLRKYKPRVLYLSLGETDDWAHDKRYDRTLQAAQYFDRTLERLWQTLQSMDEYRDRTTLLISADHGRGSQLSDWFDHGAQINGAEHIWMAALGPDTPPQGEATNTATVHQRDISATLLDLLGLDWRAFCEDQGKPVALIAP
ncbi:MAG: hypothetical protein HY238_26870 [Acidobacteria bacterium]|nr:hypothetical protein [Acidobacteriota bacterium]